MPSVLFAIAHSASHVHSVSYYKERVSESELPSVIQRPSHHDVSIQPLDSYFYCFFSGQGASIIMFYLWLPVFMVDYQWDKAGGLEPGFRF